MYYTVVLCVKDGLLLGGKNEGQTFARGANQIAFSVVSMAALTGLMWHFPLHIATTLLRCLVCAENGAKPHLPGQTERNMQNVEK